MSSEDRIKREWNVAAEAWTDFVRTGKDYTRDVLNNPAAFDLIGDVKGLIVLDLACGEGYNTRILARKGANVTGVDLSENLIEQARREEATERLGIRYHVLDAANLEGVPDNHFDLVACFMSLQDIEDCRKAVSEVARVLKCRGRFVFSIPHPCFEKISIKGRKTQAARRYFETAEYRINWNMERLEKPFKTTSFHRTLTDYSESLHTSSLVIRRLIEPRLEAKASAKHPYLKDAAFRPQSVIIESLKIT